jgi:methionyl-tRNA synthetase
VDWGIPVPVPGAGHQRIYAWMEMCPGYLYGTGRLLGGAGAGEGWEAVWRSPDAQIVQFFGFDNAYFHAVLFPALLLAYDPGIRLPDVFVVNEFYLLDGKKFSTSRRHAVWGGEFLPRVPADLVRFYLAYDRPARRQTSFTLAEFRATVRAELLDGWEAWLGELGRRAEQEYGGRAPDPGSWTAAHRLFFDRVQGFIRTTEQAYQARTFAPDTAARTLCELVRSARELRAGEGYLRLTAARRDERRTAVALELLAARALAVLAAPLMPGFSTRLWAALGFAPAEGPRWESDPRFLPGGQTVSGLASFRVGTLQGLA